MQINKNVTIGFLFGYFTFARIVLLPFGIYCRSFLWNLLDGIVGMMVAILMGILTYDKKKSKGGRKK